MPAHEAEPTTASADDAGAADDLGTADASSGRALQDQLLEVGAERATVLTDGVVAIALTLLALDLKPDLPSSADSHQLAHYLSVHSSQYVAFALAFYLIAQYWLTHHRLTHGVRRATTRLLVLTLFFLFGITVAPLTTYLTGAYSNPLANMLFAANIAYISIVLSCMGEEIHARRLDDRVEGADDRTRRRGRGVFSLAIPVLVGGLTWVLRGDANYFYVLFFAADVPGKWLVRRRARRERLRRERLRRERA